MIVPTIMPETLDALRATLQAYQPFARRIHIDISDGEFAPVFLLSESQLYWPEGWEVDIHAMVARPSEHLPQLIQLKPSMIILHAEAQENILPHIRTIKEAGIRAGVALLKTTVPSSVEAAIREADHVMIFSGELGKYGGTASMMQLEKVRLIKRINNGVEIGWDGGVTAENAFSLSQGGVDVLYVGGAIQKAADPETAFNTMMKEVNKQGAM